MCFTLNFLFYPQRSIRVAAAGGWLIVDLSRDRRLMGTVAGPEVCLYSRSRFLHSCDLLTTLEVSQLFQGINNGSGSPYLTFMVQAACFVVVIFYLSGIWGRLQTPFCSRLHRSPSLLAAMRVGSCSHSHCLSQSTAFILCVYGCARGWLPSSSGQGVPRGSPSNAVVSFISELLAQM